MRQSPFSFRTAALAASVSSMLIWGVAAGNRAGAQAVKQAEPHAYGLTGDFGGTHDPSIIKEGDTWYVFATGRAPNGGQIPIRCSKDLIAWKQCGSVLAQLPDWITNDPGVPHARDIWAPDISYFDGKFHLYYAYSAFGKNTSGIGLATNVTLDASRPDYKWVDEGFVLRSVAADDFNAIDPNLAIDKKGQTWLALGSFWSGIKLVKIDRQTGKPAADAPTRYALATRTKPPNAAPARPNLPADWQAVEAPFIVPHAGYYYLFVSWDLCCKGAQSTYRTMVGRAKKITGPYLDKTGKAMSDGGGSELLAGNDTWVGPGGESVLLGKGNDPDIIVYHAYDAVTGRPALQISTLAWKKGWPLAAVQRSTSAPTQAAEKVPFR
jgi:arabinan endo-1,5-alpha-L-arabinosidase